MDALLPAILAACLLAAYGLLAAYSLPPAVLRYGIALGVLVCFGFVGRRIRFALGVGALFTAASFLPTDLGPRIYVARNFFGTKTVVENAQFDLHEFVHSGTVHGIESTEPGRRLEPLSYYSRSGPLGGIFAAARSGDAGTMNVAVVGLGVGTIACYRLPGERWTFFEIDPQVLTLARDRKLFWYLSSCAPDARVVIGDGRLEVAKEPPHSYGLLVLDAYSSDQPPVHMLTKESFEIFRDRVAPGGLIAFHISNRFFDLTPIIGNLVASVGWRAWIREEGVTLDRYRRGDVASQWVVIARSSHDVGTIAKSLRWKPLLRREGMRLWTDDYSSLILALRHF